MKSIFLAVLLASVFVRTASAKVNIIDEKTIDVSFPTEELSLTCRMGLNGLSYISLNAPTLNKALKANVRLSQTSTPVLQLTSPFISASTNCQENSMDLTKFIVASGTETTAHLKLSLVETTTCSFGMN